MLALLFVSKLTKNQKFCVFYTPSLQMGNGVCWNNVEIFNVLQNSSLVLAVLTAITKTATAAEIKQVSC